MQGLMVIGCVWRPERPHGVPICVIQGMVVPLNGSEQVEGGSDEFCLDHATLKIGGRWL